MSVAISPGSWEMHTHVCSRLFGGTSGKVLIHAIHPMPVIGDLAITWAMKGIHKHINTSLIFHVLEWTLDISIASWLEYWKCLVLNPFYLWTYQLGCFAKGHRFTYKWNSQDVSCPSEWSAYWLSSGCQPIGAGSCVPAGMGVEVPLDCPTLWWAHHGSSPFMELSWPSCGFSRLGAGCCFHY